MPLYDYRCDKCEAERRDFFKHMADPAPNCPKLPEEHGQMRQEYQTKVYVFDSSMVFEHLDLEPKQFGSRRELRRFCQEKGVTSHYVD